MQYIILIGDENLNLNAIKSIVHYQSISSYDVEEIGNRFCVDYGEDHIFYDYVGNLLEDYDEKDLQFIPFQNPHFIMMVYSSEKRMKEVLQQDNFLRGIYVDNDFGLIVSIEEFIQQGLPMNYEHG